MAMQWDDPPLGYRGHLTAEDLEEVDIARQRNAGLRLKQAAEKPVKPKKAPSHKTPRQKEMWEETQSEKAKKKKELRDKALESIKSYPKEMRIDAFKVYWKSLGNKRGTSSYYRHIRNIKKLP